MQSVLKKIEKSRFNFVGYINSILQEKIQPKQRITQKRNGEVLIPVSVYDN